MKTPLIVFNLLLITCMISTAGSGQTTNVWGKVIDKHTQKPLYGVNISLQNDPQGIGTITNQNGEFRLWNIPSDTLSILISFNGYQDYLMDINSLDNTHNNMTVIYLNEETRLDQKDSTIQGKLYKKNLSKLNPWLKKEAASK